MSFTFTCPKFAFSSHICLKVCIEYEEKKYNGEGSGEFKIKVSKDVPHARELIDTAGEGWIMYLLDYGLTSSMRICDALETCEVFQDVTTGARSLTIHQPQPLGDVANSNAHTQSLNPSQRRTVETILEHGANVQLIKGPPGTGKTNTLTALLRSLLECNLKVHATAPTNFAVHELARRFFESVFHVRTMGSRVLLQVHYTTLYHSIPYYTTLYHTIPYYTTLYHTIPHYTTLYHTIPHYTGTFAACYNLFGTAA